MPFEEIAQSRSPRATVLAIFEDAAYLCKVDKLTSGPAGPCVLGVDHSASAGLFRKVEEQLRDAILRGHQNGDIPLHVDPQETPRTLLAIYLGLRLLIKSGTEEEVPRSIIRRVEEMLS